MTNVVLAPEAALLARNHHLQRALIVTLATFLAETHCSAAVVTIANRKVTNRLDPYEAFMMNFWERF